MLSVNKHREEWSTYCCNGINSNPENSTSLIPLCQFSQEAEILTRKCNLAQREKLGLLKSVIAAFIFFKAVYGYCLEMQTPPPTSTPFIKPAVLLSLIKPKGRGGATCGVNTL